MGKLLSGNPFQGVLKFIDDRLARIEQAIKALESPPPEPAPQGPYEDSGLIGQCPHCGSANALGHQCVGADAPPEPEPSAEGELGEVARILERHRISSTAPYDLAPLTDEECGAAIETLRAHRCDWIDQDETENERLRFDVSELSETNSQLEAERDALQAQLDDLKRKGLNLCNQNGSLLMENARLVDALKAGRSALKDAHKSWDSDNDTRCGKILIALLGGVEGYREDADKFAAALAPAQGEEKTDG